MCFLADTQHDRITGENSIGALILATEARGEVGPDIREAAVQHLQLAEFYKQTKDQHGMAAVLTQADADLDRSIIISHALSTMSQRFVADTSENGKLLTWIHLYADELRKLEIVRT